MMRAALLLLVSCPQLPVIPEFPGDGAAPRAMEKKTEPPTPPLMILGTKNVRLGGAFHTLVHVDGKRQILGAWDGSFELWQDGFRALTKRVGRGIAYPAPDGKSIAVVIESKKIELLDAMTGKVIRLFRGEAGPIAGATWSPCGRFLAAGVGPVVFLWEAATGKVERVLTSNSLKLPILAFSPDGTKLAGGDRECAQVWDIGAGAILAQFDGGFHRSNVTAAGSLAFSADAKILVGGCFQNYGNGDGRVGLRQWDVATGKKIRDLEFGTYYSIAFTPDGNDVWAGTDRFIYRWQLSSGKQVSKWLAHAGEVRALAVTRDGKSLSSAGTDLQLRSWHVETGEEQPAAQGHVGPVLAVAFSPDGAAIASEGEDLSLRFWDVVSGKQLRHSPVLASGNRLAGLDYAQGGLAAAWKPVAQLSDARRAVSPDGRLVASARINEVVLREAASEETVATFSPDQGTIRCIAFASHGRTLAAGSEEGGLTVWDVTGRLQAGKLPAVKLTKEQLITHVALLRGKSAARAHAAIWTLASAGRDVVPLLEELMPRPDLAAKFKQWIADLGDPAFAVRDKAMKHLAELADQAEPSLLQAAAGMSDLEIRRRVELLLRKLDEQINAKWQVQVRRALAVLEYSATQEAHALLERVAQAVPQDPSMPTVHAILKRWPKSKER